VGFTFKQNKVKNKKGRCSWEVLDREERKEPFEAQRDGGKKRKKRGGPQTVPCDARRKETHFGGGR